MMKVEREAPQYVLPYMGWGRMADTAGMGEQVRVTIAARVSSEKQMTEGYGHAAQVAQLRELVKAAGWVVARRPDGSPAIYDAISEPRALAELAGWVDAPFAAMRHPDDGIAAAAPDLGLIQDRIASLSAEFESAQRRRDKSCAAFVEAHEADETVARGDYKKRLQLVAELEASLRDAEERYGFAQTTRGAALAVSLHDLRARSGSSSRGEGPSQRRSGNPPADRGRKPSADSKICRVHADPVQTVRRDRRPQPGSLRCVRSGRGCRSRGAVRPSRGAPPRDR